MQSLKKNSKTKKAIIEVGFSWIFILIAGVVILSLFTYIGIKQGGFFKDKATANLLTDLNAIFVGAQVSKNTAALFEIPKTKLGFGSSSYNIEGKAHPVQGRLIYGPEEMETDTLITWSKPWSLGFRISNFLFVTSPYIKYYIVYSSAKQALAEEIYEDLPTQLSKEMISLSGTDKIENQNYDRIVVLVLGAVDENTYSGYNLLSTKYNENDFDDYDDDEVTFIYLFDDDWVTETILTGTIAFKDRNQDLVEFPAGIYTQGFYDISALYAAFISGNQEIWQGVMDRSYIKARDVLVIYYLRALELASDPNNALCSATYSFATGTDGYFSNMEDHLNWPSGRVCPGDPSDSPAGSVIISSTCNANLRVDIYMFDYINTLLDRSSCPLIY